MATADERESTDSDGAYDELTDRYAQYAYLSHAGMVVGWDQQVMMPDDGAPARAKQLGALSTVTHDLLTDERIGELLGAVSEADLDDEQAAEVREIRREYERSASVPSDLVTRLSEHRSENQRIWQEAKADDDYESFAPRLDGLIDLERERSAAIDPDRDPYEVQYEDRQPYLPLEQVEEIFEELRDHLVPLIERIETEGRDLPDPIDGTYDAESQEALCREALDVVGYDWDRGRLDTAPHPFMSGTQFDARVTTRYDESSPLAGLMAVIHEYGHASYQQGLRQDAYGSPLGQSRSSGVHESQSRFWENHVGRTKPFWELFLPTVKEHFPSLEGLTVDEAYAAVNQIYPNNLIRVEADELTYHLHIILRCELDSALVRGDLDVADLPEAWNRKMDEYLGIVPETDTRGCLQDIHWSSGLATFHGYTVGSVLAAQLDAAMREDLDVDGLVREGEFDPIREWQEEHVHRHGQRYPTDELIEVATGEPLTAEYFLDYVDEKFTELYDL
ncbi:carboxypeptidase M32 [Halovivax gelatinilyticus]|uniref:carboxypeptidase M32 n=1 Tax=Halovivax gelatinilyticus TaxID=2961597 RepID=UPI0020CA86E9|nr:carboxypeptidase M32 [Halovivax gelatinilyticus]